jgi:hypothetical protein
MVCAYNDAMTQCQNQIEPIKKDSSARYKYASYEVIREKTAKIIASCGLAIEQWHVKRDGEYSLVTLIKHKDGYEEEKTSPIVISDIRTNRDNQPLLTVEQQLGCAITYTKRYVYNTIFGIATYEDDVDGQINQSSEHKQSADALKCPKCNGSMKLRHSAKTGQDFWGCTAYPNCNGVMKKD